MITLLLCSRAIAWETDQYTLPSQPIAETGEEVSRYVYEHLIESVHKVKQHRVTYTEMVNTLSAELKMLRRQKRLRHSSSTVRLNRKIRELQARLNYYHQHPADYFQTKLGMADSIQKTIGTAISQQEKKDAIWGSDTDLTPFESGIKGQLPVKYYPNKFDSVYAYAGFHRFLHPSHFILSSTIKLYGFEIGMDKLGHFFNEGYQYYSLFEVSKKEGDSDKVALEKTIAWGVDSEDTFFGSWVSGIYSNADLASNYAGLHFYLNLFSPITLNGITYPPILRQDQFGDYTINKIPSNEAQILLKRYISHHMNEALNPSSLEYLQYIVVEKAIENRCVAWQEKYPDPSHIIEQTAHLNRWNGDEYGFDDEHTISIFNRCFKDVNYFEENDGMRVAGK